MISSRPAFFKRFNLKLIREPIVLIGLAILVSVRRDGRVV
jgi:hypothetical protein